MDRLDYNIGHYALSLSPAISCCASLTKKLQVQTSVTIQPGSQQEQHLLVPPNRRAHRSQVPKTVCIKQPSDGGKVEQLQAHRQDYPSNDHSRPGSPRRFQLLISLHAKPAPQNVLHHSDSHIGRHVVRVVPSPQSQVGDVRHIH